jgi:hypothetical protein
MTQAIDIQQVIIQGIKDLPQQYLDEVADFVFFLREKRIKQQLQVPNDENQERREAMLKWVAHNRLHAPKLDPSIDIRALIDQTHDREI